MADLRPPWVRLLQTGINIFVYGFVVLMFLSPILLVLTLILVIGLVAALLIWPWAILATSVWFWVYAAITAFVAGLYAFIYFAGRNS